MPGKNWETTLFKCDFSFSRFSFLPSVIYLFFSQAWTPSWSRINPLQDLVFQASSTYYISNFCLLYQTNTPTRTYMYAVSTKSTHKVLVSPRYIDRPPELFLPWSGTVRPKTPNRVFEKEAS